MSRYGAGDPIALWGPSIVKHSQKVPFTSMAERHARSPAPPINRRLVVVYTPKCRSRFQRCTSANHSSTPITIHTSFSNKGCSDVVIDCFHRMSSRSWERVLDLRFDRRDTNGGFMTPDKEGDPGEGQNLEPS